MKETLTYNPSIRQWKAKARVRISKGEAGYSVEADFINQGLNPETAKTIIDEAVQNLRFRAIRLLVGSTLLAGLGLLVSVASYSAATSSYSDGAYILWWGPIVSGSIMTIVALKRVLCVRK